MENELELERRRAPDDANPFVNRLAELDLIQAKLDAAIDGGRIRSGVVCFWGAFGLGKSWLLLTLEERYRRRRPACASTHPTVAACLDLDVGLPDRDPEYPTLWQEGRLDRGRLIRELWRPLAEQMDAGLPDLGRDSPDAQAAAFVGQVTQWAATSATPVLMLDTVDHLVDRDRESFAWFEQHVVERLVVSERVLFVLAGRGDLRRWDRFQVRRRVTSRRLEAFGPEATAEQVGMEPEIGQALHQQAFGHPLATDSLRTALERAGMDLQTAQQALERLDPALLRIVLERVVREIVAPIAGDPQLQNLARHACVLRWLHVEPLRFLAEQLGIAERGRGDQHYLNLLNGLQAEHLLYWNGATGVYEFDPLLRRLLARYLELEDGAGYCAAHDAAYRFHQDHLGRYPAYLGQYVPELAYHGKLLARCCPATPHPSLPEWWRGFLSEGAPSTQDPWQELVQALAGDRELQGILLPDEYDLLYQAAQERAGQDAHNPRR